MKRARVSHLKDAVYLSPDDIRFSQDTISATFANGKPIGKTLDDLVNMDIFVPEIPPILVAKEDGAFYTRNNRRLWVFKQLASMNRCSFIPCFKAPYVPREQFTTMIGGHEIIIRGDHRSETLDQFKGQKRREMLKRIRNRQIADDAPRATFTPRFEYMRDQKRRKMKAKRKLAPRSEDKKETFKEYSKDDKDKINQDSEDYRPAKSRKLEKDVKSKDSSSEVKVKTYEHKQSDKQTVKDLKSTEHSIKPLVRSKTDNSDKNDIKEDKTTEKSIKPLLRSKTDNSDKNDIKEDKIAIVKTKLEEKNKIVNKETSSNKDVIEVVIDLTGDDNDDVCPSKRKSEENEKKNDVYKFTAKDIISTLPKSKSARRRARKRERENNRYHTIEPVNIPRSINGLSRETLMRDNASDSDHLSDHIRSEFSYDQNTPKFDSNPSKLNQPRRYLIPTPIYGHSSSNRAHEKVQNIQNSAKNSFKRPDYITSERRANHSRGRYDLPIINSQREYLRESYEDQMLGYDRF